MLELFLMEQDEAGKRHPPPMGVGALGLIWSRAYPSSIQADSYTLIDLEVMSIDWRSMSVDSGVKLSNQLMKSSGSFSG
ncbi:hypothetical protein TIFTF001_029845 [Ficus carica]|uniref:Uncharacterized protein n=1 Tax=Ficus carica TaxID=3494 RepID=A0AA88DSI7_FICCA|nr:hypothetical protein TIFTF001_029845 [Ficus carica]